MQNEDSETVSEIFICPRERETLPSQCKRVGHDLCFRAVIWSNPVNLQLCAKYFQIACHAPKRYVIFDQHAQEPNISCAKHYKSV